MPKALEIKIALCDGFVIRTLFQSQFNWKSWPPTRYKRARRPRSGSTPSV